MFFKILLIFLNIELYKSMNVFCIPSVQLYDNYTNIKTP